ncbi:MAG: calcium-binding protein [Acidobacteriota bacterium]
MTAYGIFNTGTGLYEFFGTDSVGDNFCCMVNPPGFHDIQFHGSPSPDTMQLFYTAGGMRWDMAPGDLPLEVHVHGRDSRDYLYGGNTAAPGFEENFHGGPGDDYLYGYDGDDDFFGGPGQDRIYGGLGDDYAHGGGGTDLIHGEAGRDILYGGQDGDYLYGYGDRDLLVGGQGDDSLLGMDGPDTLIGESGSDFLQGGAGDDLLCGGTEGETYPTIPDFLDGNGGDDLLWGTTAGGAGTFNDGDAGSGFDQCGDPSLYAGCEATLTTAPVSCP